MLILKRLSDTVQNLTMKNKIILFLLLGFFSHSLMAQEIPGKRDSLNSTILKEKRVFNVILPTGYKPAAGKKYDVIYVLDDWNIKLLSQVEEFVEGESMMPPAIIVGILNVDRDRDLLPTHNAGNKTSGGANKFLSFMKDELIPYINKTYPANGDNTLFGHSFGGVFVTYALLTEPQLFKSYIAADPSYWWDDNVMLKTVPPKLAALAASGQTLYVTGRLGNGMTDMRIPQMDSILKKSAPAGLNWKLTAYPDETHGSVRFKSAYDGLRFSYAGYNAKGIRFHPMSGIVLKDQPIHLWYFADTANVRYTTDGTEPIASSTLFRNDNQLTAPGKVTIKKFAQQSRYNETFSGTFETGNYLPAGKLSRNMKPGGFNYAYYEGQWNKLPDFKTLKAVKTGKIDSGFDINKLPRKKDFALLVTGQMEVKEDGYYVFAIDINDGTRFYLDNKLLIDLDGARDSDGQGKSYIVPLKKGFYPVREEYFQKTDDHKLDVEYLTPTTIKTKSSAVIPLALQYGLAN
jgi:predicted alpha/beta superfamily hydrolase